MSDVLSVLIVHEGEISKHLNNYDHGIARRSIIFWFSRLLALYNKQVAWYTISCRSVLCWDGYG